MNPPLHFIHLHYLDPFFEALPSSNGSGARSLGTLFTYRRLRSRETDGLFTKVRSREEQDTLWGFLRILGFLLEAPPGGRYLLLVHQLDYSGPYALILLLLLAKRATIRVQGPGGLQEEIPPRRFPRIAASGLSFIVRRLRSIAQNMVQLRRIPLREKVLLKRTYPRLDRVPLPRSL